MREIGYQRCGQHDDGVGGVGTTLFERYVHDAGGIDTNRAADSMPARWSLVGQEWKDADNDIHVYR